MGDVWHDGGDCEEGGDRMGQAGLGGVCIGSEGTGSSEEVLAVLWYEESLVLGLRERFIAEPFFLRVIR